MQPNYELYFVTDESVPTNELLRIVEEAVKGGVTIVQLREKHTRGKIFYEKAYQLKQLLKKYQVPLIINDRVDIALAIDADGVHIGQKDLPLTAVKKIVPPSMIVGVSASNIKDALEAEKNGADYIGVGAVFPTKTKEDATLVGKEKLATIIKSVNIPVVAIGGIHIDNLSEIAGNGAAGIAVVSGIMKADNPQKAALNYLEQWEKLNKKEDSTFSI